MRTSFNVILKNVTELLNEKLPKYLTYHNTAHTIYVLKKAIDIAKKEHRSLPELELIKLAALYHDIGFTKTHIEHEKVGCEIAKKQLKDFGYSNDDINIICGIIMATKLPQNPKTPLEQIVADADLEYLATNLFVNIGESLFQELKHFNKGMTRDQWNEVQINFISSHTYHTKYCKHYKSHRKNNNLKMLKMLKKKS